MTKEERDKLRKDLVSVEFKKFFFANNTVDLYFLLDRADKCDEIEYKLACLIDYISEGKYSKPEYDLQSLKEIHDNAIHDALEELEAKCKIYEDALNFYAKGCQTEHNSFKETAYDTRMEFGCGCCVGTKLEDGTIDYEDDSFCGLTAREALEKAKVIE